MCESIIPKLQGRQNVKLIISSIVKFNVPENDFAPIKEVTN